MKYLSILLFVVACAKAPERNPPVSRDVFINQVRAYNTGTYNAGTDTVSGGSYSKVVSRECGKWNSTAAYPEFAFVNCKGNPSNPYSGFATCAVFYDIQSTNYYSSCF